MKKSVFIIFIVLLFITISGIGGYVYIVESTKPIIGTKMSERSKEFLENQKHREDSDLRSVNLERKRANESDFDSNRVTVMDCYSVVIPFPVADDRQHEPCVYYAILESPVGNVTTNLREVGYSSVNDAPDVVLRRGKKDQYREESFISNNRTYLVFTDIQTNVEKTAFGMIDTGEKRTLFTVSLGIGGDDALKMRQLKKIADSLEVL